MFLSLRSKIFAGFAALIVLLVVMSVFQYRALVTSSATTGRVVSTHQVLAPADRAATIASGKKLSLIAPSIAAVLALLMAIVLSHDIGSAIGEVAGAARDLAAGDLDRRVAAERRDEVGVLAAAFMGGAVRTRGRIFATVALMASLLPSCGGGGDGERQTPAPGRALEAEGAGGEGGEGPDGAGSGGGAGGEGGAGDEGGAAGPGGAGGGECEDGSARACRVELGTYNGVTSCFEGVEICRDGAWGHCQSPSDVEGKDDG